MTFLEFASAHGLIILDSAIPDSRVHRCATQDKPHKRNGAYLFDGISGWVQNHATMDSVAVYSPLPDSWIGGDNGARARRARDSAQLLASQSRRQAAKDAKLILDHCAIKDNYPYMVRKGLGESHVMVYEPDNVMVVPMYSSGHILKSIQFIDEDGDKRFLSGGSSKSCYYPIGRLNGNTGVTWLVEGYANGVAVKRCLSDHLYRTSDLVLVCFSSWNIAAVAASFSLITNRKKHEAIIIADNDRPDSMGRMAGLSGAIQSGLPFVMSPEPGVDAADLWRRGSGLERVILDGLQGNFHPDFMQAMPKD